MADLTDKQCLTTLVGYVNAAACLDASAMLDYLDDEGPAASVQQLPGARWVKRYVDGSGIREQPFAVNYRVAGGDTNSRANAAAALLALADYLEDVAVAAPMTRILPESTPSRTEIGSNGSEVWTDRYVLESKRG